MIDFRYHLVSIVAVLLALSIGVVLGTGAIGGPLLEDLRGNVEELRDRNSELLIELNDVRVELRAERDFVDSAEPHLIEGSLDEQDVVVIEFEGTAGGVADDLRESIRIAEGRVAATIEILDRFSLQDQIDIEQLELALTSVTNEADELRSEAAAKLGERLGRSAAGDAGSGIASLLQDLQDAEFVDVERDENTGPTIPDGAVFLMVGGDPSEPAFDIAGFALALARSIDGTEATLLAAEPTQSSWGLLQAILNDGDAPDAIATADGIETAAGRVAAILGLERAIEGEILHLGHGPGADLFLPEPTPPG